MRIDRLKRLLAYMEKLPDVQFNFNFVIKPYYKRDSDAEQSCGTIGCMIGHCGNVFKEEGLSYGFEGNLITDTGKSIHVCGDSPSSMHYINFAMRFFELSVKESDYLFSPGTLKQEATATEAAAHLRTFISDHSHENG